MSQIEYLNHHVQWLQQHFGIDLSVLVTFKINDTVNLQFEFISTKGTTIQFRFRILCNDIKEFYSILIPTIIY